MKKLFLVNCFLILSFFLHAQVTLEECQRKAKENYPLIRQQELIQKSETYLLSNLSKNYLPQISVGAKASYQSAVTELPVQIPGIQVKGQSKDQYQMQLEVNQTIWDGGVTSNKKALQRASREVDEQQLEVDLYPLEERVDNLFFGVLLLEEELRQNEALRRQLELNKQQVQACMNGGIANAADLDEVEVTILSALQQKDECTYSLKAYRSMLSLFTGEDLSKVTFQKPAPVSVSGEIDRPELSLLEARIGYLEEQKRGVNRELNPRLGAFVQGGYGRPGLNMLKREFEGYYIAGLRVSWNLSPFYTRKNTLHVLENSQQELRLNREAFLLNTRMDLSRQQEESDKQKKLMQHDDEIIRLRGNIRKASEVKLQNGTLNATDLMRDVLSEHQAYLQKFLHEIQWLKSLYQQKTLTNNP